MDFLFEMDPFKNVDCIIGIDNFLDVCNTGDILLISGNEENSRYIKAWAGSKWSHVGIVIEYKGKKYIYHSDPISRINMIDWDYKEGSQLNDLELFLKTSNAYIYYRPLLNENEYIQFREDILEELFILFNDIGFNRDWVELLRCTQGKGGGIFGRKKEKLDEMFCSQFVARVYHYLGVIDDNEIKMNEYHPSSFSIEGEVEWKNGFYLGNMYRLEI